MQKRIGYQDLKPELNPSNKLQILKDGKLLL
jgi:hypothetical protein